MKWVKLRRCRSRMMCLWQYLCRWCRPLLERSEEGSG